MLLCTWAAVCLWPYLQQLPARFMRVLDAQHQQACPRNAMTIRIAAEHIQQADLQAVTGVTVIDQDALSCMSKESHE